MTFNREDGMHVYNAGRVSKERALSTTMIYEYVDVGSNSRPEPAEVGVHVARLHLVL